MRKKLPLKIALILLGFLSVPVVTYGQDVVKKDSVSHQATEKKESGDRGVMLSASSSTGPRDINVGLPPGVGGSDSRTLIDYL